MPVGVENLAFVATKICLFSILFSKSTREVFTDKVALSRQVRLWFTDAAIPYYTPSPPPVRGHALGSSGLGQGNRSQCPVQSNKSGNTLDIYTCTQEMLHSWYWNFPPFIPL